MCVCVCVFYRSFKPLHISLTHWYSTSLSMHVYVYLCSLYFIRMTRQCARLHDRWKVRDSVAIVVLIHAHAYTHMYTYIYYILLVEVCICLYVYGIYRHHTITDIVYLQAYEMILIIQIEWSHAATFFIFNNSLYIDIQFKDKQHIKWVIHI